MKGELVVLAEDHLYGHALTSAGIGSVLVSSDAPVDLDWDFASGVANVVAAQPTTLRLSLKTPDELRLGGQPVTGTVAGGSLQRCVAQGTPRAHRRVAGHRSSRGTRRPLCSVCWQRDGSCVPRRWRAAGPTAKPTAAELPVAFASQVGGKVADDDRNPLGRRDRNSASPKAARSIS